jgi:hypothetical protein
MTGAVAAARPIISRPATRSVAAAPRARAAPCAHAGRPRGAERPRFAGASLCPA